MNPHVRVRAVIVALAMLGAFAPAARAQFRNGNQTILLEMPRISQRAVVTQRIGLTDITVTYHRPRANGRQVFGDLVPYGRVWRAGANDNTTIEFTHPLSVSGTLVPAGRYALFMIPGQTDWTIILSKNSTSWGAFSYDPAEDQLRVRVKPMPAPMRETMVFEFADPQEESTSLEMRWERLAVPVPIAVDVKPIAVTSLRNQLRHLAGFQGVHWFEAAMYCVDHQFNYPEALTWINQAVQLDGETYDNLDLKSQILDGLGRKDEAAATLTKALALAGPDQMFAYGLRLLNDKKIADAEKVFASTTTKHPESWRSWYGLAQAQAARGDRKAAEKSLIEAMNHAERPGEKAGMKRMLERLAAGQSIGG